MAPVGDPSEALPGLSGVFDEFRSMALALFTDNLGYIIAVFVFYLAVRFAPALISWFRHRNDPKQLNLF